MSKANDRVAARVFFALGDPTRLSLLRQLGAGHARSATSLADGAQVTRQAIVKHLRVLERAGLVRHQKKGREVLFAVAPRRLREAGDFLTDVSASWDRALERLCDWVERPESSRPNRPGPRARSGKHTEHPWRNP